MPKLEFRSYSNSSVPASFAPPSELSAQPQTPQEHASLHSSTGSRPAPLPQTGQRGPPVDVKTMEQDLRRILNLNTFGSTPGVPGVR
jgi:hypothetical protein